MSEFALPKAEGRELLDLVAVQYYTLEDLVDEYFEATDRDRYLELLKNVDQLVLADVRIPGWDAHVREGFVSLCCLVGEKLIEESSPARVAISARLPRRLADVAVLAASAGDGARERVRNMACEFWVRSRSDEISDEEIFVRNSADALLQIDSRGAEVERVIRRAMRLAVSRRRTDQNASPTIATPASVAAAQSAAAPTVNEAIAPLALSVWQIPPSRPREQVVREVHELLEQLKRDRPLTRCLSNRTMGQLRDTARNKDDVNGAFLYWAGSELWGRFVETGDGAAGDCARKLATLRYELAAAEPPRNRANAYMAMLCTQLPEMLTRATPKYLITEAIERGKALDLRVPALTLHGAVIEAYAGRCRQLYARNDRAALAQLLDGASDLSELWEPIENSPMRNAESVVAAWQYIVTLADVNTPEAAGKLDGVFREKAFCDAIRAGTHSEVILFVTKRSEELQERLRNRLDYRVSPQNLMIPDGTVYNTRSQERNQPHALFVLGRDRLKNDEYARAAEVFNNLAHHAEGRNRLIAKSFEAYALARDNNLLRARPILSSLADAGYARASTFWNLACCYGPTESQQQLQALTAGVDAAPHMWTLNAAVYLALILQDQKRLLQWLPFLTFAEAVVLRYHMQFDALGDSERDDALLRIDDYIREGEPQIPDPRNEDLTPRECDAVLTTLLNRHLKEAMEFWLRCREPVGYRWFTYWQLRADFYEKTGRRGVAAEAFEQELQYRLSFLSRSQGAPNQNTLRATRLRIEQWLNLCRTPQLTDQGRIFYTRVRECEERTKIRLLPNDRRLHEYYAPRQQMPETQSPREIPSVIARAATVCSRQFHTLENLSVVRPMLAELSDALTQRGATRAASALNSAVDVWSRHHEMQDSDDGAIREKALSSVQQVLSVLDAALVADLSRTERDSAESLLRVFRRVTDRFARDLKLLPKLIAEACGTAGVVGESASCVFAIRILSTSATVPVRLSAVAVGPDNGDTSFVVRDDLRTLPVLVTAQSPAIITVDASGRLEPTRSYSVQVAASYEYSGTTYGPDLTAINVNTESRTQRVVSSPFVYGTMVGIDVDSIPRQFVGREREKEEIFDALANRRPLYLDGIRRVGKSSLLNSIVYELRRREDIIPCRVLASSANTFDDHGGILLDLFRQIAAGVQSACGVTITLPERNICRDDTPAAFAFFVAELRQALGNRSALVLLDEFQVLIETANGFTRSNPRAAGGLIGILNMIATEQTSPDGKLLWLFAGHLPLRQYMALLPGPLLWGVLRALPVNFLDSADVTTLMRKALANAVGVPNETVQRLYAHTKGHPEVVQQMAESMLLEAVREGRDILTPYDADRAARDVAAQSDDSFRDTWYPIAKLSLTAKTICADLVKAIGVGERIQQHLLAPGGKVTPEFSKAIDDLRARQVIDVFADGNIAIKAYVLDLWLRKHVADSGGLNGSVATFIDVANLTRGTGANSVLLDSAGSDCGVAGKYQLATVFEAIENYGRRLSAAPMAATWAINYPPGSPAVLECNLRNYDVKNIPEALIAKGSDDAALIQKINDVRSDYPLVDHFVIVTGDIDYSITINELLAHGKHVHVISRRSGLSKKYNYFHELQPNHFSIVELEQLLDQRL